MSNNEGRIIHKFNINPLDSIRLALHNFNGRTYLDIRIWKTWNDETVGPSKKGLRFDVSEDVSNWEKFVEAVHETDRLLKES